MPQHGSQRTTLWIWLHPSIFTGELGPDSDCQTSVASVFFSPSHLAAQLEYI